MLSPTEPSAAMKEQMSTRLPRGKTIIDIFADFMRYLFDSTKALFKASEPNGELRWNSVSNNIELVLSHPNGWGGLQQTQLRTAVARAGIVPDSRVHFVTEGEASFNFCVTHTQAGKNLKVRQGVLTQRRSVDMLAARRTGCDRRCGWWNYRYQYLHSPQQWAPAGDGAIRSQV